MSKNQSSLPRGPSPWLDPYQFFTEEDVAACKSTDFFDSYYAINAQSNKFTEYFRQLRTMETNTQAFNDDILSLVCHFVFRNSETSAAQIYLMKSTPYYETILKPKYNISEDVPTSLRDITLNRIAGCRPDLIAMILTRYPDCVGETGKLPKQLAFLAAPAIIPRTTKWKFTMTLWRRWCENYAAISGVSPSKFDFAINILYKLGFGYFSEIKRVTLMYILRFEPVVSLSEQICHDNRSTVWFKRASQVDAISLRIHWKKVNRNYSSSRKIGRNN